MNDAFQKTVLQGEILALLHDIGKLTWRFVGPASGASAEEKHHYNHTGRHTTFFLADVHPQEGDDPDDKKMNSRAKEALKEALRSPDSIPDLQKALLKRLDTAWVDANGQSVTCLASLIGLHHYCKDWRDVFAKAEDSDLPYPDAGALAMYADTSDSQFSKGAASGAHNSPLEGDVTQKQALHLAAPQGGVEHPLDQKTVDADAKALAEDLVQWAGNGSPADWDTPMLWRKRNELRKILETRCSRHLAETRIPNNDVSLWQHTSSVAGIFKALLASRMLSGEWKSLLKDGGLSYTDQKLAILAFRWDDVAFLARSMRSFEIVGRRARLHELSENLKLLVEKELCIGNEIYRDHSGICFLVPDLSAGTAHSDKTCCDEIIARMERIGNGELFHGDLPWKIRLKSCSLRLTDTLELWREDFDSDAFQIASGPSAPDWEKAWASAENRQICPRCGLRPIPWSASRTGSSADTACDECRRYINDGAAVANDLRSGKRNAYADTSFGDLKPEGDDKFWQMLESETGDSDENRLALVQGIIPLDGLYDGSFFDSLLSPPKENADWKSPSSTVAKAWDVIRNGNESTETRQLLEPLLGAYNEKDKTGFGGEKDGWCCNAPDGKYQREWIRNLILPEEDMAAISADKAVRRIVLWAARQHPSPSRLSRMWGQTRMFMQRAFKTAEAMNIPYVPLTCDAGVFQILLPAGKALPYAGRIADTYAETFGRVRHVLPLHLSASVFYHKAPLYIAMDTARRFARLARQSRTENWTLVKREDECAKCGDKIVENQTLVMLEWEKPDGRSVTWSIPATLPNGMLDLWHTWFQPEDAAKWPVPLRDVRTGMKYRIRPSTFDFEVLDASTRRYDIRSDTGPGRRPHFMMPQTMEGPRPYPLEILKTWNEAFAPLFTDKGSQNQRKLALELLARLHCDWKNTEPAFESMVRDILINTFGNEPFDGTPFEKAFLSAAVDGTLFDLYEWYDFLDTKGADQ